MTTALFTHADAAAHLMPPGHPERVARIEAIWAALSDPAFDALEAFRKDGTVPAKWIQTESKLYTQADDPAKVYEEKKGLGY